jgi:hypothetical protein
MKKRPTPVTVVAWILIVVGISSLVAMTLTLNNPATLDLMSRSLLPISLQYVLAYAGFLVTIVSGIVMLKGRNWGRLLYVVWSAIGSLIGLATSPLKLAMIPGIVVFLIFTFFLFRPSANAYFQADPSASASA